jgi:glycosyltransferase involved in cell wall biosynthesis
LTEQKGQRYLLEAVSYLHTEYPNLRVLFVGEGEDHNQLIDLAKGKGVFEIVRFLGYRQDIPQILHLANALVLPSLYEGLPVCVLEAMACAKPVIATNVGGTAETVFDGKTGFLVEAKNSQALACGIRKLINLPDRGKEMGQKARELANGFSIKSVAQKTSELLLSLANKV